MTSEENNNEPVPEYKYTEKDRKLEDSIFHYLKQPKDYQQFYSAPATGNQSVDDFISEKERLFLTYGSVLPSEYLLEENEENTRRLTEIFPNFNEWAGEISNACGLGLKPST